MNLIHLYEATEVDLFGRKAVNLGKALQHRLPVPTGYLLSASAVQQFARGELNLESEIRTMLDSLGAVSVRSSASQEDGELSSYAGLFHSCLNVTTAEGIERAIRYVWNSAQSNRLRNYMRRGEGATAVDEDEAGTAAVAAVQVALIVQRMIASDVSGIMFTRNPVTNADERVIEATWGLGEAVASGYVTPDYFRMNRNGGITEATASMKEVAVRLGQYEGTIQHKLADNAAYSLCLTAKQCSELNRLAAKCEDTFGPDIDIEWAFAEGELWLLQCRRITGQKLSSG
ncbi:PEP/pyruvate-binding domain-containing protein [Paenibacillus eucommiae]|uniref:Pyruvate,water dikinase n=1 Tax=Paenibacillus eucommiae TaxID=1355755 RepID=A0ABS4IPL4_9BACL|nr:PEP/pyruvate-binding domain-containing protein [Paenibacillus eucommiae]MBP1989512.1 pyruvate,water dikinase [Paenibacillus eucommiae]